MFVANFYLFGVCACYHVLVYRYASMEVEIWCIYVRCSDELLWTSDHCASDDISPHG